MVEPSYQELGPDQIVTAYPEGPQGPVKIRIISGKSHGAESPVRSLGGCWYFHMIFDEKSTIFQEIREWLNFLLFALFSDTTITAKGWTSFIYVLKGSVSLGSQPTSYDAFNTLVLTAGDTETGVSLTATANNTEFVLVGFGHSFSHYASC